MENFTKWNKSAKMGKYTILSHVNREPGNTLYYYFPGLVCTALYSTLYSLEKTGYIEINREQMNSQTGKVGNLLFPTEEGKRVLGVLG